MNEFIVSRRSLNFVLAGLSFLAIGIAYGYFQKHLWLEPCAYCILQRLIFALLGGVFLWVGIINPKGAFFRRFYAILIALVTGVGLFVSGKHSWLQLNPNDSVFSCGQNALKLNEFFDYEFLRDLLLAKGDCSSIEWTFLGLSIPMWTFITFLIIGGVGVLINSKK